MGIDNLTHVKKGQRLSAYTVNSIIDAVKGTEKPGNFKPGKSIRAQTFFYTSEAIPPYSIFPLIPNATSTYDTFYSKYTVEKYQAANSDNYVPGLFGTNGRLTIPAETSFFGYIITADWDSPIVVSDYSGNAKNCGFKENSWEATTSGTGLYLNGKAPQGEKTYYARKPEQGGAGAKVKFAKYNQVISGGGKTEYKFAPTDESGNIVSADSDTYLTAKIPPYLTIDQIQIGGIYRIEYIPDYGEWFLTDGQCSEYVSPYAPVRMTAVREYPNTTASGNFDDTTSATGISSGNVYVNATYNQALSDGAESDFFSVAPTINAATFSQNFKTYWRYTFSGMKLKSHAKGIACYNVYATDGDGAAYSAYRLSFNLETIDCVPELEWTQQTIDIYLGDETQIIDIATVTDADGDTITVKGARLSDEASLIDTYSLSVASGKISLSIKPVGANDTQANYGVAHVYFQLDDGYLSEADSSDDPYQLYTVTINIRRRQQ